MIKRFDVVQSIKDPNKGALGIVTAIAGNEVACWGVTPASEGRRRYRFTVESEALRVIGSAVVRPVRKGEEPSTPPSDPPAVAQPKPRRSTPPIQPPKQASSDVPMFGVDSSDYKKPTPPTNQEPIDPELLKPAVFKRPSAAELHPNLIKEPHDNTTDERTDEQPKRRRGKRAKIRPREKKTEASPEGLLL